MNKFRKLQERLRQEGWYVGWNHYCCQSCAWDDVPFEHEEGPFTGKDVDLDKVLFNHSQDCQVDMYDDDHECGVCGGNGFDEDDNECEVCEGRGWNISPEEAEHYLIDGDFVCYTPEQQTSSMFCFSGSEKGVQNLKEVLYIFEELAVGFNWSGTVNQRIEIIWD